jgi:hypothetical protein
MEVERLATSDGSIWEERPVWTDRLIAESQPLVSIIQKYTN